MIKLLSFTRTQPPSINGYNDPCVLFDENFKEVVIVAGRTSPNPFRPSDKKPWDQAYGLIDLGTYPAVYDYDASGRLCFIINEGKEIPSAIPNSNHDNRCVITSAEVHCGFKEDDPSTPANEDWSGSAACCTIRPSDWAKIMKYFKPGDQLRVEIRSK